MLWLCLHFPLLPVELRQPADHGPVAVVERQGQHRQVIAVNAAAQAANVRPGQDLTVARLHEPHLHCIERSAAQEKRALQALADWAHQWSSVVTLDPQRWLIALEAGASLRYFSGLDALQARLLASVAELGYTVRAAVAPTWEAAALLACSGRPAAILSHDAIRTGLANRPLTGLAIGAGVHASLQQAGMSTIDEVLDLPRDALARRFGPAVTEYLQRLLGERPDPRPHARLAQHYRRTIDCASPVDSTEALLFPLRRMLQEFQGYLRGRDVAVESLHLSLCHREAAPTNIDLRLGMPQREAAVLLPLLRERLERTALPEPVMQLVLAARRFVAPTIVQGDFFEDRTALDARWSQMLDRLRARLGEAAVRTLHLQDDHRPGRAGSTTPGSAASEPSQLLPERPVWILDPRPLKTVPTLLGRPERIEAGWWDADDQRRDYYVAQTAQGALWWVYRDLRTHEWFLHGIWA